MTVPSISLLSGNLYVIYYTFVRKSAKRASIYKM
jgi:hypothetical protein